MTKQEFGHECKVGLQPNLTATFTLSLARMLATDTVACVSRLRPSADLAPDLQSTIHGVPMEPRTRRTIQEDGSVHDVREDQGGLPDMLA
jgi:hypothetical protein